MKKSTFSPVTINVTSYYTYFNPNPSAKVGKDGQPKRWAKGDCVIRAFCAATAMSWEDIFGLLCKIAMCEHDMPNSDKVIAKAAEFLGFTKFSFNEYMTVAHAATTWGTCRTAIFRVRGHVVCCKSGKFFDTWNCGAYKVKTGYMLTDMKKLNAFRKNKEYFPF